MLDDFAQEPFCYVTTRGRRSGREHTVEMWFAAEAGTSTIYMLNGGRGRSDWFLNIVHDPQVTVRIRDRRFIGRGRALEKGTDEDGVARRIVVAKYMDEEDLDEWGRTSAVMAVDLRSGPPPDIAVLEE